MSPVISKVYAGVVWLIPIRGTVDVDGFVILASHYHQYKIDDN